MLPRMLRSLYRQEPLTGMILTAGAVNVAIGGLDGEESLVLVGLGIVGLALGLRWLQTQKRPNSLKQPPSARYQLPDRTSHSALPNLRSPQKPPR